jgi:hypothetical protein
MFRKVKERSRMFQEQFGKFFFFCYTPERSLNILGHSGTFLNVRLASETFTEGSL